jgi:hypothetical protein
MAHELAWVHRLASDLAARVDRTKMRLHGDNETDIELNDGRVVGLTTRVYPGQSGFDVVARVGFSGDGGRFYEFNPLAWSEACKGPPVLLSLLIYQGLAALLHDPSGATPGGEPT